MKSAYELAMERLQKQAPSITLTDEQKAQIADVESLYKSRIAERELFLKEQIAKAQATGDLGEVAQIERQLASELKRLREECEEKKERVREGR
jgi:hypothetical protein